MQPQSNNCALVIGVDAYQGGLGLTSACNDAFLFADTLVKLELVGPANINLLTLPMRSGSRAATDAAIEDAFRQLPATSAGFEKLFVFFSGHGVIARSGDLFRTSVLLPSYSGPDDGAILDWQHIIDAMGQRGAAEQYWFLDACRNLDLGRKKTPRKVKFALEPRPEPRAQAWLYGVSFGAVAQGVRGGNGFMTVDLIAALRGDGLAQEYNRQARCCQITMPSICDELTRQARIRGDTTLPVAWNGEKRVSPIRVLKDRGEIDFTVFLKPRGFERAVHVFFSRDNERIGPPPAYVDPHAVYGTPVKLKPLPYEIEAIVAQPQPGAQHVEPSTEEIDPRIQPAVSLRLLDSPPDTKKRDGDVVPGSATIHIVPGERLTTGATDETVAARPAHIIATAHDTDTAIVLEQHDVPRETFRGQHMLDLRVPAGRYTIQFVSAGDVVSRDELTLPAGGRTTVTAHAATSSLAALLIGAPAAGAAVANDTLGRAIVPATTVLSESIGPMQTHVAETILPLLGLKAFDPDRVVLRRSPPVLLQQEATQFALAPVSVVVALEGDWAAAPQAVLTGIRTCLLSTVYPHVPASAAQALKPLALSGPMNDTAEFSLAAFERIGIAYHRALDNVFGVRIGPLHGDYYDIRCAAYTDHITVVTVFYHASGKPGLSVHTLPVPRWRAQGLPLGLEVRQRVIARAHLAHGRIASAAAADWLAMVAHGEASDPIDSVLACYALEDEGDASDARARMVDGLQRHFPWLPDVRVLRALHGAPDVRERDVTRIVRGATPPIAARSVRILVDHARDYDLHAPWLYNLEELLLEDQPLVVTLSPEGSI